MMKSRGWELYVTLVEEHADCCRRMATQRGITSEDRWWNSAQADGLEQALTIAEEQHA